MRALTKKEEKAAKDEKMLFAVCLDLWFAESYYSGHVLDLTEDLKDARRMLARIKKNFKKAEDRFETITGRKLLRPKI